MHYENGNKSDAEQKDKIEKFYRVYRKIYIGIESVEALKILAGKIISSGIKEKDAYHVASAILAKCNFFITVDDRLLKYKSDEIILMNPIEFVNNWSEENDR